MVAEEKGQGSIIGGAVDKVFNSPTNMFVKTTVREYIFDGVRFCTDRGGIPGVVCLLVEQQGSQTIRKDPDDSLRFSFFNHVSDLNMFLINKYVRS